MKWMIMKGEKNFGGKKILKKFQYFITDTFAKYLYIFSIILFQNIMNTPFI